MHEERRICHDRRDDALTIALTRRIQRLEDDLQAAEIAISREHESLHQSRLELHNERRINEQTAKSLAALYSQLSDERATSSRLRGTLATVQRMIKADPLRSAMVFEGGSTLGEMLDSALVNRTSS